MLLLTVRTVRRLAGVCKRIRRREVAAAQVRFLGGPDGLQVRFAQPDLALACVLPGPHPAEDVTIPLAHLTQCKGRPDDPVTLEQAADGDGLLRWQDHGIPQVQEWTCPPETGGPFDQLPQTWAGNPVALLDALDEAGRCTEADASRYALDLIQLRDGAGQVVATDGRQLLVQDGFRFPWQDDVLLPASKLFGSPDLREAEEVRIGKVDDLVVLQSGPWTCWLRVEKERRFPAFERVLPDPARAVSTLRLDDQDTAFVAGNLRRLPGGGSEPTPVTVDLNGHVGVRTREEDSGRMAEVVLDRSSYQGSAQRISLQRPYLARILDLGFDTIHLFEAGQPLLCTGPGRKYVVVPLVAETAVAPQEDCLRLHTRQHTGRTEPPPPKENPMPDVPEPPANGHVPRRRRTTTAAEVDRTPSLLEEVQQLRDVMRDALERCGKVAGRIREQRKQSRLVKSTLASLRQLQTLDA